MEPSSGGDIALAFVGGFIAALLLVSMGAFIVARSSDAYSLDQWKLNAKMPLTTMWMNLGYWTNDQGERIQIFQEACATLLKEILKDAQLLADTNSSPKSLAVLDLGFGCGDQTFELVRLTQPAQGWNSSNFRYVGLTLDETQLQAASRTTYREIAASDGRFTPDSFRLFCANASRPAAWNPRVREAVESLAGDDDERFQERWLLALDCIYYFKPSRKPVLEYAARHLGAGAMAFDLVLNPEASLRDRFAVRAVGFMMGCPLGTFLTIDEYKDQLVECGYERDGITIRDISEHVFPGVVDFIAMQERALSQYGISLGGFKLAGRLFDWFGRTQVVKAVIVVARKAR